MNARQETCCFTGHRPDKLPWRDDEGDPRCVLLKERIHAAVLEALRNGFRHFICGMAQGCDLYFGESVLRLREGDWPEIRLEAAIPCPDQPDTWPPAWRERYRNLLRSCDIQTVVSRSYYPGCMQRRDRYMVDHASLLIAAYDGTPGGTRYTVEYAMRRGLEIVDLHLETLYKAAQSEPPEP